MYKTWMSYLGDDVKLVNAVMPGTHNAATKGLMPLACNQDDDVYTQFLYGVRHFSIRVATNKKGKIVISHSMILGEELEKVLYGFHRILTDFPSEFFIIDLRPYGDDHFGKLTFKLRAEPSEVDKIVAKTLSPEYYAFTEFDDINSVTMADIRKSGKRFMLYNPDALYAYSVNPPQESPWHGSEFGQPPEDFAKYAPTMFDVHPKKGLYHLQTQQTASVGSAVGLKTPRTLEKNLLPYYFTILDIIKNTPRYLDDVNIIAGDFMTAKPNKCREILRFNLIKNNIIPELASEFTKGLEEFNL